VNFPLLAGWWSGKERVDPQGRMRPLRLIAALFGRQKPFHAYFEGMDQQEFQTDVIQHFKDLEKRMNERFDQVDQRFLQMDARMDTMQDQIRQMQQQMSMMQLQINEIYQSRNLVKIKFGMEWIVALFVIAVLASGITLGFGRS
jgi:uncharacterized protein YecA (UPF0149 family)